MTLKEDILRLSGIETEVIEEGKLGKALAIGATILALSAASALGGAKVYERHLAKLPVVATAEAEKHVKDVINNYGKTGDISVKAEKGAFGKPIIKVDVNMSTYFDTCAVGDAEKLEKYRADYLYYLQNDIEQAIYSYLHSLRESANKYLDSSVKVKMVNSAVPTNLVINISAKNVKHADESSIQKEYRQVYSKLKTGDLRDFIDIYSFDILEINLKK